MKKLIGWFVTAGMLMLGSYFNMAMSSTIDEVEQYDLRFYSPINYGLKDLVFEVRVSNLTELLRDEMALSTVVDVYFKVYWIFPGQFRVNVEGLPRGFEELRAELRQVIRDYLEIAIPEPLGNRLRSYQLGYKSRGSTVVVEGLDQTHTRPINRIELRFEPNGRLKSMKAFSSNATILNEMESSVKNWSHNKWVLDVQRTTTKQGQLKTITESHIKYSPMAGIGLPQEIEVTTKHRPIVPEGFEGEVTETVLSSTITFSNFEVNTGKAQRYIVQGLNR